VKLWKLCLFGVLASSAATPVLGDDFIYPPPTTAGPILKLWSTRYYVHYVESASGPEAAPLYRPNGMSLGVSIPQKQFCFGALQGTLAIRSGVATHIYNAAGLTTKRSATCTYAKLKPEVNSRLGRQAWTKVTGNGEFGLGVLNYRLLPFRTIAVDKNTIPYGTVLFIPALKGVTVTINSAQHTHDGYVIAGDTGGAIKGNHVDFFTGSFTGPPPAFVTSRETGLFDAQVVSDPTIIEALNKEAAHMP
jgi:3D (Asp-Asp-Asp) domain-containing protein